MIKLRPYQNQAVQALRDNIKSGKNRLVLCAPTGGGKTVIFSYMVSRAVERGKKCLIITHRSELLTQAGGALTEFGLIPIYIKPGNKIPKLSERLLIVGMAQTLKRRLKDPEYQRFLSGLDLAIIDEAHTQDAEMLLRYFGQQTTVIGATATPHREGNQSELADFYNNIVEVTTIPELVNSGFLANPHTYGVKVDLSGIKTKAGDFDADQVGQRFSDRKLYRGVYENYMKLTPGRKAIIFASNVQSSKDLVADFESKGLPIRHIDGTTPAGERKAVLRWFKTTPGAMVSNVGILNAGFDEPTIEVVILYRATKSLPLFLQMCGRGSRTTSGKSEFFILDFGNNIHRHGFWEESRPWSLRKKKKKMGEGEAPVKDCPECAAMVYASVKDCPECGHHFVPTEKEQDEEVYAELQRMTYQQIKDELLTADFKRLEQIARAKGYNKNWIYHQLSTEQQIREYAQYKNYHARWVEYQLQLRAEKYGKAV